MRSASASGSTLTAEREAARALRRSPAARRVALFAIKAVHLVAFMIIQSAILFLLYSGLRGRSDRRAAAAAGIATAETLIYVRNGMRCPLTGLAEDLGSAHGQVTDIFLPQWLARNIANIYTPLFAAGIALHARNIARARSRQPHTMAFQHAPTGNQ